MWRRLSRSLSHLIAGRSRDQGFLTEKGLAEIIKRHCFLHKISRNRGPHYFEGRHQRTWCKTTWASSAALCRGAGCRVQGAKRVVPSCL